MRSWFSAHDSVWSSQLLQTEAIRAAGRLGIDPALVEDALETISLVLPSVATFYSAGRILPETLRSLDAMHLATAVELGDSLEGIVAYDDRLIEAAQLASIRVVTPV